VGDNTLIPAQIADISVDWLNERLGDTVGTITDASIANIGEGVGILGEVGRITLTYADGETGPATMIAKCQSIHAENVMLSQMMGFYVREVSFYQQLASTVDLRVPQCFIADIADEGVPFVLILEDITGTRMIDQVEGATREDTMLIAETVAALHATYWNNEALFALDWLPPMNNDLYKGAAGMVEANWNMFVERYTGRVDADVVDAVERLTPKYTQMLDWWIDASPPTLAHTDCRAENYLFGTGEEIGQITMLDFQLLTRHVGVYDIANFLGQSVTVEDRRAWQDEVVDHYHSTLLSRGVTGYDIEHCRRDYRYCLLHQAFGNVAVANIDPGNDRGRLLLDAFVTRVFAAAADNNSVDLLSEF